MKIENYFRTLLQEEAETDRHDYRQADGPDRQNNGSLSASNRAA